MPEVLKIIEDSELAWVFLTREMPFADELSRPIDKLKRGQVEELAETAAGYGEAIG